VLLLNLKRHQVQQESPHNLSSLASFTKEIIINNEKEKEHNQEYQAKEQQEKLKGTLSFKVSHKALITNDHYLNYGTWRLSIVLSVIWRLLLLQMNVTECLDCLDAIEALKWGGWVVFITSGHHLVIIVVLPLTNGTRLWPERSTPARSMARSQRLNTTAISNAIIALNVLSDVR
jgi:hypothetical protein